MKLKLFFFLLLLIGSEIGFSQKEISTATDSLSINGRLGLRGRWQTGNLDQVSLMPSGNISFSKIKYYAEFNASYHFLKINGFKAINDLWLNGLYQHHPFRRIFPSVHITTGFAKSYQIDHSIVTGIGVGANVHKKSISNFLQTHLFGGYLNFQYEGEELHKAPMLGSQIRAMIPIHKHINFRWELSSYHSLKDKDFWGGGNFFQLNFIVLKNLMVNINHQTYYNRQTTATIKNTNTEMLFGIQYFL